MKARVILAACLALAFLIALPERVLADPDKADWWKADKEAGILLVRKQQDIAKLASEACSTSAKSPHEAMLKLNILLRAGMNEAARKALEELHEISPDLGASQVSTIFYKACDDFEAWPLAQRVLEVFAEDVTDVWPENRLFKHWRESGRSIEAIDQWLSKMPAGRKGFWIKQRIRFNVQHHRADPLIAGMIKEIKENPQDADRALIFLDALIGSGYHPRKQLDLSWMAGTVKPEGRLQPQRIASHLKSLEQWKPAMTFFRLAIAKPLSETEIQEYGSRFQMFMSPGQLKALFSVGVLEDMAQCLLKLNRNDEAQKMMVQAADMRKTHQLGMNAHLAGAVQSMSGARVIEGRIKEAEALSQDDPQYWRKRAEYYRGRREPKQEEAALVKALSLVKPLPPKERPFKGYSDLRSWILSDYAHFLQRQKRGAEALALIRKEIETSPAASESSKKAAYLLAFDFRKQINPADDLLWRWLSQRPVWEYVEERLVWRMLENAAPKGREEHFARAEALVQDKDPSRAYVLGWIMNRLENPKRSIPLLNDALERAAGKDLKEKTAMILFESYLDVNDWARAEQIFPEARKRLTVPEETEWYTRIAVAAAASGAKEDAMRIWRVAANANPARPHWLRQLARHGLADQIKEFYARLAERLPESEAPKRALAALEGFK